MNPLSFSGFTLGILITWALAILVLFSLNTFARRVLGRRISHPNVVGFVLGLALAPVGLMAATRAVNVGRAHAPGVNTVASTKAMFGTPNTVWYVTAQNAQLSADSTQAASGYLDWCSGAQPASGVTPSCASPLCSATLSATPFHTPSNGTMTNNGVITCTGTAAAGAGGTAAGFVVLYKSNHTTPLATFSMSTSGANFNFPSTTITTGEVLSIADGGWTLTAVSAATGY